MIYDFVETVNEFGCKPNKLQVDQGNEFYDSPIQKWSNNNDILTYSACDEGKSVIAERFIGTSESKTYKNGRLIIKKSSLGYSNKLIDKYNNTYQCSVDKKSIDDYYSALTKQIGTYSKLPKRKVGDRVRIANYKNNNLEKAAPKIGERKIRD